MQQIMEKKVYEGILELHGKLLPWSCIPSGSPVEPGGGGAVQGNVCQSKAGNVLNAGTSERLAVKCKRSAFIHMFKAKSSLKIPRPSFLFLFFYSDPL